jgi:hypothetical protein
MTRPVLLFIFSVALNIAAAASMRPFDPVVWPAVAVLEAQGCDKCCGCSHFGNIHSSWHRDGCTAGQSCHVTVCALTYGNGMGACCWNSGDNANDVCGPESGMFGCSSTWSHWCYSSASCF